MSKVSPVTQLIDIDTIAGSFMTYNGQAGVLVRLEISGLYPWRGACPGTDCNWTLQGNSYSAVTSTTDTETIANDSYLIGWE